MVSTGLDDVMQFMPDTVAHETGYRINKCRRLRTSDGCLINSYPWFAGFHVKEYPAQV